LKYFTPELWASWSEPGYIAPPPERDPFVLYRRELETLRNRVAPEVYSFFIEADVHDGTLVEFAIREGVPLSPSTAVADAAVEERQLPVGVALAVEDGWGRFKWTLHYTGVRRVDVRYAAEDWARGFDDWGYQELTDAGGGFLRHEVLFASDSILLVEFLGIEITRTSLSEALE
jgi:hypothetical protein